MSTNDLSDFNDELNDLVSVYSDTDAESITATSITTATTTTITIESVKENHGNIADEFHRLVLQGLQCRTKEKVVLKNKVLSLPYLLPTSFFTNTSIDRPNGKSYNVSILVQRDKYGIENFWFPERAFARLCSVMPQTLRNIIPTKCRDKLTDLLTRFDMPRCDGIRRYGVYIDEIGLNYLLHYKGFRSESVEMVRQSVSRFHRYRREVVVELIRGLIRDYIQANLPVESDSSKHEVVVPVGCDVFR